MSDCETVVLTGGVTVPLPVMRGLLELEARGVTLSLDGDGIIARPKALLTNDDRRLIREWRPAVVAVLDYCERVRVQ